MDMIVLPMVGYNVVDHLNEISELNIPENVLFMDNFDDNIFMENIYESYPKLILFIHADTNGFDYLCMDCIDAFQETMELAREYISDFETLNYPNNNNINGDDFDPSFDAMWRGICGIRILNDINGDIKKCEDIPIHLHA